MTTRNAGSLAQMRAKRLNFDRFVLDLDRGCLLLDGNEVALRPKTFAVLHHLIENCGSPACARSHFPAALHPLNRSRASGAGPAVVLRAVFIP